MATRATTWATRLLGGLGALALLALGLQGLVRPGERAPLAADGCTSCHAEVTGLEAAHAGVGCDGCHRGNAKTADEALAHQGVVRIPGQFTDFDETCGSASCHASMPARLRSNIMTTMNGVVSVDRWAFGEQAQKRGRTPVDSLGHTPADSHLRNLCASCHLGAMKTEVGPLTERSRGGGCLACHLVYEPAARVDLARRDGGHAGAERLVHPKLSSRVPDEACFGCHSRSGRVSLNYQGWHEGPAEAGAPSRTLEDGRRVTRAAADVHAERGLGCTDCHGSWEVMGSGTYAMHREDQAVVACDDCHQRGAPASLAVEALDPESANIARREGLADAGRRVVMSRRGGFPLLGAAVSADGGIWVTGRFSGRAARALPPAAACARDGAHRRVSCPACHEAWAPVCVSCHTRFDATGTMFDLLDRREAPGEWHESGAPSRIGPAALGARVRDGGAVEFETFIPGMILSLSTDGGVPRFQRLFAPIFAHTIRREPRSCESCHRAPLALGYGPGELSFARRAGRLRATFAPASPARAEDGLPPEAWIGFLDTRGAEATTRDDTRPLSVAEQRRVLAVGACLTCHPANDPLWERALAQPGLPPRSPRCAELER